MSTTDNRPSDAMAAVSLGLGIAGLALGFIALFLSLGEPSKTILILSLAGFFGSGVGLLCSDSPRRPGWAVCLGGMVLSGAAVACMFWLPR